MIILQYTAKTILVIAKAPALNRGFVFRKNTFYVLEIYGYGKRTDIFKF